MTIPPEILALVNQLNQELDRIEQSATNGLNLARLVLSRFRDNARIIELFGILTNALFFVEMSRRRVQFTIDSILPIDVTAETIQEAGEDLAELLGRTIENKMLASRALAILEELQ